MRHVQRQQEDAGDDAVMMTGSESNAPPPVPETARSTLGLNPARPDRRSDPGGVPKYSRYRAKIELYDEHENRVEWAQVDLDLSGNAWRGKVWDLAFALVGWLRARRDG